MALNLANKKILVVDDFPEMRSMMRKMGVSCKATDIDDARNGEDAITKMAGKKYDIVLCDYNLGNGKDGQQVLEEAKHRGLINHTTIFMMLTAENTMDMVMGAVEYSPDGYLTKPFTKAMFDSRLEKIQKKKAELGDIQKAIFKDDKETAIKLCNEKLGEKPPNALEILKIKADLCMETGDLDAAAEVYNTVLAKRAVPWASLGLGIVHFRKEDYGEAEAIFEGIISENEAFLEAYDWLAKTHELLGNTDEAQRILTDAINVSPKTVVRQQQLAKLALKNEDLEAAEDAFKKAIKNGKNSCFKNASDYTGLAKVHLAKDAPEEALKVVGDVRGEFGKTPEADLHASVMESTIYHSMGKEEEAIAAVDHANALFSKVSDKVDNDVTMDLAKACFEMGKEEDGKELIKYVVRNHHEDKEVLKQAQELFNELGMESEGEALISDTRQEVIDINNQGVKLAMDGKFEESIELFSKAADGLPENLTINLNATQSLIMHMRKNGKNNKHLKLARQFLDRAAKIDPTDAKFQKLLGLYKQILSQ
jgi:tetratricopeptide (TPR) repeat protein